MYYRTATTVSCVIYCLLSSIVCAKQYSSVNSLYKNIRTSAQLLRRMRPSHEEVKRLTDLHNTLRRKVPATNMRRLDWSNTLADSAQASADRCDFKHTPNRMRPSSENIWAAASSNHSNAPVMWFNEVNNRYCNCNHAWKSCCGHYIVLAWATSHEFGCGASYCSNIAGMPDRYRRNYVFVCHYAPKGGRIIYNFRTKSRYAVPAYKLQSSDKKACSECPEEAPHCDNGLCYSNPWKL